jgi:hypothetical protein
MALFPSCWSQKSIDGYGGSLLIVDALSFPGQSANEARVNDFLKGMGGFAELLSDKTYFEGLKVVQDYNLKISSEQPSEEAFRKGKRANGKDRALNERKRLPWSRLNRIRFAVYRNP